MKPKIFIAQPIAPAALSALEPLVEIELNADSSRILSKAELIEGVKKADILLSLLPDVVDADVLRANPNLKMVASMAIVPSSIDLATATSLKIPVTGIPAITTAATADLAWGLMLAVARKLIPGDRGLRAGMFPGGQSMYFLGGAVTGKTLGVVGLGRIGEAVARRAAGFEMEVLYLKRSRLSPEREAELGVNFAPLDDLLRRSDYVVIAAASTPETRHLIGAAELAMMKPAAILVNIARGVLVDEKALVEALEKGAIGGAGLDVFEREPHVEPGLLGMENVVLLPHLGSAVDETREEMTMIVVDNIKAFIEGKRPPNVFNGEIYG